MVFEKIIADYNMLVVKEDNGDVVDSLTIELSAAGQKKFASCKKGDTLDATQKAVVLDYFKKHAGVNIWRS